MKQNYASIILLLTIVAAIVVAGCTSSNSPGGNPTANSTAGGLTLKSLIDISKLQWYDYQITATIGTQPISEELRAGFGVDYNGTTADRYNQTVHMMQGNNTTTIATDLFMDHSTGNILGGHMNTTVNGNVTDQSIPATTGSGQGNENPLLISGNATLTSAGTDSVTVPAGTYTATKYTWSSDVNNGSIWIASNVPVPVKMEYAMQGRSMEMELAGWK